MTHCGQEYYRNTHLLGSKCKYSKFSLNKNTGVSLAQHLTRFKASLFRTIVFTVVIKERLFYFQEKSHWIGSLEYTGCHVLFKSQQFLSSQANCIIIVSPSNKPNVILQVTISLSCFWVVYLKRQQRFLMLLLQKDAGDLCRAIGSLVFI